MVIDAATGAVLRHEAAARKSGKEADFDSLFAAVETDRERAEAVFEQEQAAYADRDRLLERKFEDALERVDAADDGKPPPSPFDLD